MSAVLPLTLTFPTRALSSASPLSASSSSFSTSIRSHSATVTLFLSGSVSFSGSLSPCLLLSITTLNPLEAAAMSNSSVSLLIIAKRLTLTSFLHAHSTRSLTAAACWFFTASISAVFPFLSCRSSVPAPSGCFSSNFTVSECQPLAASMSAVAPRESTLVTLAPCATSISTMLSQPLPLALTSAVCPSYQLT